jgi:hypothetical protein
MGGGNDIAGEAMSKWLDFDQDAGDTRFRLEINTNTGLYGYGDCWDVASVKECDDRQAQNDIFNVKGPFTRLVEVGKDATEFQMLTGPAGRWGWQKATTSSKEAFSARAGARRARVSTALYSIAYWRLNQRRSVELLQEMTNLCSNVEMSLLDFTPCRWTPWKGKQ